MTKYDMSGFISAIVECCKDFSDSWEINSTLDIGSLDNIKSKLNNFTLSHKKEIFSMYDYAEREGKYKIVDVPNLLPIIEKFEEYYSDLSDFVNVIINIKDQAELDKKQIETISRAAKADQFFYNKFFGEGKNIEVIHTSFPKALSDIEMIVHLDVLFNDIRDTYLTVINIGKESDRIKMITDLYTTSTMRFLTRISEEVCEYISLLMKIKDNVIPKETKGVYKLI